MKKLLKFSASWCGPCKSLTDIMKHVNFGDVELIEIDIDENMEKSRDFNVRGVPTIVLLEDDVEIKRHSGVLMANQIEDFIK